MKLLQTPIQGHLVANSFVEDLLLRELQYAPNRKLTDGTCVFECGIETIIS